MTRKSAGQTPVRAPAPPNLEFSWSRGSVVRIPADVAAQQFNHLREQAGKVTPELVVEAARAPESPLHEHFEWDDSEAAEAYRRAQASYLLRHLTVVKTVNEQPVTAPVRYMVRLMPTSNDSQDEDLEAATAKGTYLRVTEVEANPLLRRQWLRQAAHELEQWLTRHQHIEEYVGIREPLGAVIVRMRTEAESAHG